MLRRVEIQGFKTFANKTVIELDHGITAIVGPNGSGKSNLAEAVRWALGEQSLKQLRSRRTEDVIFAGGPKRAPSGFAEVIFTLENHNSQLALPYQEVAVTRRAYRSGENEYLINHQKVRLKDVQDLLLRAGLSAGGHVVIGQGMVDSALSLRPDERRAFFSDASAISHHQERLAEARSKLLQTASNLLRVLDIAAELAPRLPGLKRQAERAAEAGAIKAELERDLVLYYDLRWRDLRARLEGCGEAATLARSQTESARQRLDDLTAESESPRQKAKELGERLAQKHAQARDLTDQCQMVERAIVGQKERLQGLERRKTEVEADLEESLETRKAEEESLDAARAEYDRHAARLDDLRLLIQMEDSRLNSLVKARTERRKRLDQAQREASAKSRDLIEARALLRSLGARQADLQRRRDRAAERQKSEQSLRDSQGAKLGEAESRLADLLELRESLQTEKAELEERVALLREETLRTRSDLEELARQRRNLESRRDLLEGWRESQTGLYSGVRAVLLAARPRPGQKDHMLTGIIGPVGELIQVDSRYELAIETALGGHIQDVVVERWADAEVAVAFLKRIAAGRATFLPLDTLRGSANYRGAPSGVGVYGVGSELVGFDSAHRIVVESLLGHTLVVESLVVARRILRETASGWGIVTLGGEIVRSSGAITGGQARKEAPGMLGRERELRELPDEIVSLGEKAEKKQGKLNQSLAEETSLVSRLADIRREDAKLAPLVRQAESALALIRRDEAQREGSGRSLADELARIATELTAVSDEIAEGKEAAARLHAAEETANNALEAALQDDRERAEEESRQSARRSELVASRAGAESRLVAAKEAIESREKTISRLRASIGERQSRLSILIADNQSQTTALADLEAMRREAREVFESNEAAMAPMTEESKQIEAQGLVLEVETRKANAQLTQANSDQWRADSELARVRAEETSLLRSLELDLGLFEVSADGSKLIRYQDAAAVVLGERAEEPENQSAAPAEARSNAANGRHSSTRKDQAPIEGVTARIAEARRRLRGLGGVSPVSIAEFEEISTRHAFLTGQAEDLRQASGTLKEAIDELEITVRERFLTTFREVSAAFSRNFARLFGGGVGELALSDEESPDSAGIEITVTLPGKRPRGLSGLSGGERALTSVALIFALLEVNPTPFCVFDEVDAALDDANIGRFCDLLRERSALTRFLVITHNRQTMEASGALYGITIEERACSKVVSLRLG